MTINQFPKEMNGDKDLKCGCTQFSLLLFRLIYSILPDPALHVYYFRNKFKNGPHCTRFQCGAIITYMHNDLVFYYLEVFLIRLIISLDYNSLI